MFDGIQIGRRGRKKKKGVLFLFQSFLQITSFMKGGIIHNNDTSFRKLWDKCFCESSKENIRINIAVKKANSKKLVVLNGSDNSTSSFCMPVSYSIAPFSFVTVSMCSGYIMSKATFIQINNCFPFFFLSFNCLFECFPENLVCLWMKKSFFYRSC